MLGMSGTGEMQPSSPRCSTQRLVLCVLLLIANCSSGHGQQDLAQSKNAARSEVAPTLVQAQELIQQAQFQQARDLIQDALRSDPSNVEALNLLGIVETHEKNYSQAEEAFRQALRLDSGLRTAHNNLGNLYVAEQKFDLAEKEFNAVLKTAPADRDANYNLGLLFMAKGSPIAAISHFQRVHPQTVETRFNL